MNKLKTINPKLNFKFTLEFTLFFIAVAISIYLYFSNRFEEETLDHFRFKADVFSSFLEQNPELFRNNELIGREYLVELMKFNEAYYVVIENNKGSIVDAINITYAEANLYVTTDEGEEISADQSLYRVVLPVIIDDVSIGNVYVGFKSREIATELKKKTLLTALFSIFILLAGIVFTYFLSTISFKPLKKLITALDKKSDLEAYDGLASSRKDEIGVLAEKVKAIVAELDVSSIKVDSLNKKLNDVFREKIYEVNKEANQRKRAELYLRNSEKQFKQLFENAPMGMAIISERGMIIHVNKTFCDTLGYRVEEIVGGSIKNIFSDNDSVKYKPIYKLLKEAVDIDMETALVKRDGKHIYAIVKSFTLTDEKGNPVSTLIQILDISEIRKTQVELTSALEQAQESDRLKSAFLAQMSHEIRTPLNVILPSIPIIADELGSKNEEIKTILVSVENAGRRLQRTIDMILSMSAVQSGNYKPSFESFILADDIEELTGEFKTITEEKGLELIFTNKTKNSDIVADRYTANQIFQNIIGNAVKYTHTGYIKVSIEDYKDNTIIVNVEDSGIGMNEKYIRNLFSPFSQEDTGRTRKYEGNGLGLALVKEYVKINNAEIFVKSEKNKGSVFSVVFKKKITTGSPETKLKSSKDILQVLN